MNDQELGVFLVRVNIEDNRQVDELVMAHWRECLEGLEYDDCLKALIQHCRDSTEYLKPAHIVAGARRLKLRRLEDGRRLVMQKLAGYTDQARYMPLTNLPDMIAALDDEQQFAAAVRRWGQDLVEHYGFRRDDLRMLESA